MCSARKIASHRASRAAILRISGWTAHSQRIAHFHGPRVRTWARGNPYDKLKYGRGHPSTSCSAISETVKSTCTGPLYVRAAYLLILYVVYPFSICVFNFTSTCTLRPTVLRRSFLHEIYRLSPPTCTASVSERLTYLRFSRTRVHTRSLPTIKGTGSLVPPLAQLKGLQAGFA